MSVIGTLAAIQQNTMGLIDSPDKWIIKMFKFNERDTGGQNAAYYPEGIRNSKINLGNDELIYGHFTANGRTYYFTSTSLVITNGQTHEIKILDVVRTNGSFRSDHKIIDVETSDGKKHKIKIEEFPYRIQQLFYQLIETHGSLQVKSNFNGPERLKHVTTEISPKHLRDYGLSPDPKSVFKKIDLRENYYHIEFHGKMIGNTIYPDDHGLLILRIKNATHEVEIFNSSIDGYNGVTDYVTGLSPTTTSQFKPLAADITMLILRFSYSIEDYEYDELKVELGLKSKNELNNLFSSIEVYSAKNNKIELLTEFETQ